MPAWWSRKSPKNKDQSLKGNPTITKNNKNEKQQIRKSKRFDGVVSSSAAARSSSSVLVGGGNLGITYWFSGFDSDRIGHPLPQPSSITSPTITSLVPITSSVYSSRGDQNFDHGQLGFYRGYGEPKVNPQPRSPGPGSRVPTTQRREAHPLPLPPGSPTSPSTPQHGTRISSSPTKPSVVSNVKNVCAGENSNCQLSKWKKEKLLGVGTFGHVYLGFNSESGKMCTIKEAKVVSDDQSSKESLKLLNQEITMLSRLVHPNIVQYYGCELGKETVSIYLEYVSGGSVHKLLQEHGPFREPLIQKYTRQILIVLAFLHGKNTAHRDIKGANILVDPNGQIKLANFGMAKHIANDTTMLSFKGRLYWMAPEVVTSTIGYNLTVDIWSLGCTVIEMATSKPPWGQYEGVAAVFKIGNSKDIPDIPDHLSTDAKSFIKHCLQRDPCLRPSAAKLLEHPFVRDQTTTGTASVNLTK